MNKLTVLLTFISLLTGCGLVNYRTEVFIDGKKKAEVKKAIYQQRQKLME